MALMLHCMAMGIDIGLEIHNKDAWVLEPQMLVSGWYDARNLAIIFSATCSVAPSFVESVAVLRPVI